MISFHPFSNPVLKYTDGKSVFWVLKKGPQLGVLVSLLTYFSIGHAVLAWSIRKEKYLLFLRLGQIFLGFSGIIWTLPKLSP